MNCLEYRRLALQDINTLPEQAQRHHDECASCQSFTHELAGFNASLKQSMNVDVPEGLADRILLQQSFGLARAKRKQSRIRLTALAASIVLGLVLSLRLILPGTNELEQTVLAHVHDEISHLYENRKVSGEKVGELLASIDTRAMTRINNVRYAGTCPIGKTSGAHLVLEGQSGPVTVLYLPEASVRKTITFSDDSFQGVLTPGKRGSIAVIGDKHSNMEELQDIGKRMQAVLRPAA
ncbi:MAG TPA: DUF3379 family protein [Gammaproteobacteria bacterium]|nr:DUF3379 family protein [Gammaproteobacteria bacterium]